jgi:hypothetical protein
VSALFRFIELLMYPIYIIDQIHQSFDELKKQFFSYNNDYRVYTIS